MSDYKRFVSYLYSYENGIKKNNIGYARVETRSNQCKITIHIKLLSLPNATLDAYLFYRKNNRMLGLLLGSLTVNNTIGDCQFVISSDKVLNSDMPFSIFGGIIITVSPNRLLGTEWDDIPIIPSSFIPEETAISAATLENEEESKPKAPMEAMPQPEPEAARKILSQPAEEPIPEAEPEELPEMMQEPEKQPAMEADNKPTVSAESLLPVKDTETESKEEEIPDALNTITSYLLIDPTYISHFAPEYSGLEQNSFLRHGYDSYRHLILAKWIISPQIAAAEAPKDKETEEADIFYQLGVPGIYSSREKVIAEKFGFSEFKTTKGTPLKYGDFGYWLVPVCF